MALDETPNIVAGFVKSGKFQWDRKNVPPKSTQIPEIDNVQCIVMIHDKYGYGKFAAGPPKFKTMRAQGTEEKILSANDLEKIVQVDARLICFDRLSEARRTSLSLLRLEFRRKRIGIAWTRSRRRTA